MNPDVSIIVPFYNENNIDRTYQQLTAYLSNKIPNYELIFVNDGSTDNCALGLAKLTRKDSKAHLISYTNNQGRGYGVTQGFNKARGKYLIFIDADLEIGPKHLSKLMTALKKSDVAIGSKSHPQSNVESPMFRNISSKLYNYIIQILLDSKIRDHQVGLKGFHKNVIRQVLPLINEKRWLFDVELLYLLQQRGYNIKEIPIDIQYGYNKIRSSFVTDFLKLFYVLTDIKNRHKA